MMKNLDREIERVLSLLRNKIRERGFTQLQVQDQLHWGRSYISQLVTRQKALRLEQILCILDVIQVSPTEFFGELYGFDRGSGPFQDDILEGADRAELEDLRRQLRLNRRLVDAYAEILVRQGLLPRTEVDAALQRVEADLERGEDDA